MKSNKQLGKILHYNFDLGIGLILGTDQIVYEFSKSYLLFEEKKLKINMSVHFLPHSVSVVPDFVKEIFSFNDEDLYLKVATNITVYKGSMFPFGRLSPQKLKEYIDMIEYRERTILEKAA